MGVGGRRVSGRGCVGAQDKLSGYTFTLLACRATSSSPALLPPPPSTHLGLRLHQLLLLHAPGGALQGQAADVHAWRPGEGVGGRTRRAVGGRGEGAARQHVGGSSPGKLLSLAGSSPTPRSAAAGTHSPSSGGLFTAASSAKRVHSLLRMTLSRAHLLRRATSCFTACGAGGGEGEGTSGAVEHGQCLLRCPLSCWCC